MSSERLSQSRQCEVMTIGNNYHRLAAEGKEVLARSNLIGNGPLRTSDVEVAMLLLSPDDYHAFDTARLVVEIAPAFSGLNHRLVEIAALWHDLGRRVTPRRRANDRILLRLLKVWQIRDDLYGLIYDMIMAEESLQNPKSDPAACFDQLSTEARLVMIADFMGKRAEDTTGKYLPRLRTFDEAMTYHLGSSDRWAGTILWNWENRTPDYLDRLANLYSRLFEWTKERGVVVEAIGSVIMQPELGVQVELTCGVQRVSSPI